MAALPVGVWKWGSNRAHAASEVSSDPLLLTESKTRALVLFGLWQTERNIKEQRDVKINYNLCCF